MDVVSHLIDTGSHVHMHSHCLPYPVSKYTSFQVNILLWLCHNKTCGYKVIITYFLKEKTVIIMNDRSLSLALHKTLAQHYRLTHTPSLYSWCHSLPLFAPSRLSAPRVRSVSVRTRSVCLTGTTAAVRRAPVAPAQRTVRTRCHPSPPACPSSKTMDRSTPIPTARPAWVSTGKYWYRIHRYKSVKNPMGQSVSLGWLHKTGWARELSGCLWLT